MSLARFTAVAENQAPVQVQERCELCARPIAPEHGHVADTRDRRIACACRPCYLLFTPSGASQGRHKAIPERYVALAGFELTATQWDELQIPIDLAFFFYSTPAAKMVAFYPSPAGATESLLPLGAWDDLTGRIPALRNIEADVEALLVHRSRDGEQRCYIVPIDACYELVGIIRTTWKGFDGGEQARGRMTAFFDEIHAKCSPAARGAGQ